MKTILFLFVSITFILSGCKSQDPTVKEAQLAQDEIAFQKAIEALNEQEFVIEADRILFKYGRYSYVSPSTNFVSLSEGKATIQLAFNSPYAGPNGIGGITLDGNASNIKIKSDKKGNVIFSMNVQGVGVSATVSINLIAGSNQCSAIVTPNFNSYIVTFSGNLYPKSESDVFKGRAL